MSAARWKAIGFLSVLAVADVILSVRATVAFRPRSGGPQVASMGEVLGWMSSAGLLLAIIVVIIDARWAGRGTGRTQGTVQRPPADD